MRSNLRVITGGLAALGASAALATLGFCSGSFNKTDLPSSDRPVAAAVSRAIASPDPAPAETDWNQWDRLPQFEESLGVMGVRETAKTSVDRNGQSLALGLKRLARPGATPVLLLHGLAQNDRFWDTIVTKYSFARFLHAQGFDVWIGNLRNAGTSGYRSDTPKGPHHWTIDDYAIYDAPALIARVREKTGKKPFLVGHSMAAWIFEGFLAGVEHDSKGHVRSNAAVSATRMKQVRGIVTIAGVYNIWWKKRLARLAEDPVLSVDDYYKSNYELETLAQFKPLYWVSPGINELPLGWVGRLLTLPLDQIPWIGGQMRARYVGFQNTVIDTPILNMVYYAPNVDPDMVRLHAQDSLEDFGPRVLEQLGNTVRDRQTRSYYHLEPSADTYAYGSIRPRVRVPMLFIGGTRDRMASSEMIYADGYEATGSEDKQYLSAEGYGHFDIVSGRNAPRDVMWPAAKWMLERE